MIYHELWHGEGRHQTARSEEEVAGGEPLGQTRRAIGCWVKEDYLFSAGGTHAPPVFISRVVWLDYHVQPLKHHFLKIRNAWIGSMCGITYGWGVTYRRSSLGYGDAASGEDHEGRTFRSYTEESNGKTVNCKNQRKMHQDRATRETPYGPWLAQPVTNAAEIGKNSKGVCEAQEGLMGHGNVRKSSKGKCPTPCQLLDLGCPGPRGRAGSRWKGTWGPVLGKTRSSVCSSFTLTPLPTHNTSDARCVRVHPPSNFLQRQMGVLWSNSTLTPSTWR